jgi:putative phosphoesterase
VKLALMGDIHGNHFALQAVLEAAITAKVDRLLITGDLVGYYFAPLRVLELISGWRCDVVRGNHEEMLSKARINKAYLAALENRYGSGIRIALEQLNSAQVDYLCSLPHPLEIKLDNTSILLCHGSPWDVNHYVYPNTDLEGFSENFRKDINLVVAGHTHYPMLKRVGNMTIVNPGSVGQPRDRIPGACWALFDAEDQSIQFRREYYDNTKLLSECRERHPELPYLADVLERKK